MRIWVAAQVFNTPAYARTFDSVATCFFLDTARNIIEYLETIWNVLKVTLCDNCHHAASLQAFQQ